MRWTDFTSRYRSSVKTRSAPTPCAAAAVEIATAARLTLTPIWRGSNIITFYPAVIVTALLSGFRAGLACVALCDLAAIFFVLEPRLSFGVANGADAVGLTLFSLTCITIVVLISATRYAIRREREIGEVLKSACSELSKPEERLAQSQKMEVLGQLTAGLAHDFNNMNAVVIGNLDLMRGISRAAKRTLRSMLIVPRRVPSVRLSSRSAYWHLPDASPAPCHHRYQRIDAGHVGTAETDAW